MGITKKISGFDPSPKNSWINWLYNKANPEKNQNPDVFNFRIINHAEHNGHLAIQIVYPNCSNYEGHKIIVFKNLTYEKIIKEKKIDPHFNDHFGQLQPFARFVPTNGGWKAACKLLETL